LLVVGVGLLALGLINGFRSETYARGGDPADTLTCASVFNALTSGGNQDNATSDAEHTFCRHRRAHFAKLATASAVGGSAVLGTALLMRSFRRT
jgi:hypothetical protein